MFVNNNLEQNTENKLMLWRWTTWSIVNIFINEELYSYKYFSGIKYSKQQQTVFGS